MKYPSISEVALVLRDINANVQGEHNIILQVWEDGAWKVSCAGINHGAAKHYGDKTSYDQQAVGAGQGKLPGVVHGRVQRFQSYDVAREMIDQVQEEAWIGGYDRKTA